jgi:hypothetical protein
VTKTEAAEVEQSVRSLLDAIGRGEIDAPTRMVHRMEGFAAACEAFRRR